MPFTISHVAAVLPFARFLRQGKLLSAAVIGSMVPDFSLFLPEQMPRYETHGLPALFAFCLPMGLLCYWTFQLHIKTATLELLPGKLHDLWREDGRAAPLHSVRQWLLAAIGVLLGALTHLIWDGFTHENARGVRMLSALDEVRVTFLGHEFSWFRFMQHSSSVIGLAFVLWFVWLGVSRAEGHVDTQPRLLQQHERRVWFTTYVAVAVVAAILTFIGFWLRRHYSWDLGSTLGMAAKASLWGIALSLLIVSALVKRQLRSNSASK